MLKIMREVLKPISATKFVVGASYISEMLVRDGYTFIRHNEGVTIYQKQYPEMGVEFLLEVHDLQDRLHFNLFTNYEDTSCVNDTLNQQLLTLELLIGSIRLGKPVTNPLLAYEKTKAGGTYEHYLAQIPTDKDGTEIEAKLNGLRLVPMDMGSSLQKVTSNGNTFLRGKFYLTPKALLELFRANSSYSKNIMYPSLNIFALSGNYDDLAQKTRLLANVKHFPAFQVYYSKESKIVTIKGFLVNANGVIQQKLGLLDRATSLTLGAYMHLIELAVQYTGDSTNLVKDIPDIPNSFLLQGKTVKETQADLVALLPNDTHGAEVGNAGELTLNFAKDIDVNPDVGEALVSEVEEPAVEEPVVEDAVPPQEEPHAEEAPIIEEFEIENDEVPDDD